MTQVNEPPCSSLRCLLQIDELEEQCGEITREKERNTQLKRRIEELESELREKETVSRGARGRCAPRTRQVSGWGDVTGPGGQLPGRQHGGQPRASPRLGPEGEPHVDETVGNVYR